MAVQDQILHFIGVAGPTTPTKVAKTIATEIYLASAHLSDLKSQGKIKISVLKVGGSPLYYLPGQEEMLYGFAEQNLNPKDYAVLQRLHAEGVLREAQLDLLAKVALRSLKDFAIPLNVRTTEKEELFWKWHLLPDENTNTIIKEILYPAPPSASEQEVEMENVPVVQEAEPVPLTESVVVPENEEEKEALPSESLASPPIFKKRVSRPRKKSSELREKEQDAREFLQKELIPKPQEKPLLQKLKEKISRTPGFIPGVQSFFDERNITIEDQEIVRKNSEINFVVKVPSVVGMMKHFCKAKSKGKCDEKDISAAYMEAQIKKLPLLFLYTGSLTKKAEEMIQVSAFENAIIKKLE